MLALTLYTGSLWTKSGEHGALGQVLSIGETVVEVNDSGFLGTAPTIRTQLLADDSMLQARSSLPCTSVSLVAPPCSPCTPAHHANRQRAALQVHPNGLRHIRADRRINEWRAPGRRSIVKAATNERQAVIALSGGELIYFELGAAGQLLEVEKKDLAGDVACLDVAPVPEGRQRSRFLAVASYDSTVGISKYGP